MEGKRQRSCTSIQPGSSNPVPAEPRRHRPRWPGLLNVIGDERSDQPGGRRGVQWTTVPYISSQQFYSHTQHARTAESLGARPRAAKTTGAISPIQVALWAQKDVCLEALVEQERTANTADRPSSAVCPCPGCAKLSAAGCSLTAVPVVKPSPLVAT